MQLRTKLKIDVSPDQIDHNTRVCTIGSCFAYNMSQKLSKDKFQIYRNPFGTLYNPISISQHISSCIKQKTLNKNLNLARDERTVNYLYHSDLNGANEAELYSIHQTQNKEFANQLKNAKWLIITLGTSIVFRHIEQDIIVANCHKQPGQLFHREILSIDNIVNKLDSCFKLLLNYNRNLKIICTVSPVRHIRDGIVQNNLSKSRLVNACHELAQGNNAVDYFPSFEIMIDELRDYSFYDKDLIHPSEVAIDYIYETFKKKYFSSVTKDILAELRKIQQGTNHRPFNPNSSNHLVFLNRLLNKCTTFQEKHHIDMSTEIKKIKTQLEI